jgi:hypothetical protein
LRNTRQIILRPHIDSPCRRLCLVVGALPDFSPKALVGLRNGGCVTGCFYSERTSSPSALRQYDRDRDGVMDAVIMLHSGYPAEVGGTDCQTQGLAQQRIWSHAIDHTTEYSWQSSTSNLQSGPYLIGSAMRGTCNSDISRIGVLAHEFFISLEFLICTISVAKTLERELGHVI